MFPFPVSKVLDGLYLLEQNHSSIKAHSTIFEYNKLFLKQSWENTAKLLLLNDKSRQILTDTYLKILKIDLKNHTASKLVFWLLWKNENKNLCYVPKKYF